MFSLHRKLQNITEKYFFKKTSGWTLACSLTGWLGIVEDISYPPHGFIEAKEFQSKKILVPVFDKLILEFTKKSKRAERSRDNPGKIKRIIKRHYQISRYIIKSLQNKITVMW